MVLSRKPIALQDLGWQAKTALATKPLLTVIINPVVEGMDELRLAGMTRLAIAVKLDKKAQP